ncbi:MAG: FAD-dependent oxidoreductase [Hyphomonadaceae bacterium]|nr:FAD-dependent oxidoreductase [Hyphomonadaceae bacterium]
MSDPSAPAAGAGRVVIVGAGQAGGETAFRLRQLGYGGAVTLIGEEPLAPYQRPPLSKAYLSGALPLDRLLLKPAEAYAEENITLLIGQTVTWIDRARRTVRLEGGRELAWDALVLATGSRARALPVAGADLPGVHSLRTAADVDRIRAELGAAKRLVVIGAGYIGLETAAVARKLGLDVTVVEYAPRPLARVTSPEMSGFFLDVHTAAGVRFALSAQAAVIKGDRRVRAVGLADGTEIPADLVIAGVGILPETALAEAAGLAVKDGITVDRFARTSDPAIYAIGDCASRPLVHYDRTGRLESVHNAIEGGKIAAAMIAGHPAPAEEVPWFWSDQYDLKLQIAGLFNGYDEIVLRGSPAERSFALFYLKAGKLIALDAVNRGAEFLGGKRLIERGATVAPAALSDMSKPFKDIMNAALASS